MFLSAKFHQITNHLIGRVEMSLFFSFLPPFLFYNVSRFPNVQISLINISWTQVHQISHYLICSKSLLEFSFRCWAWQIKKLIKDLKHGKVMFRRCKNIMSIYYEVRKPPNTQLQSEYRAILYMEAHSSVTLHNS